MALIDRPPSRWLGALLRAPVFLYRRRLGWLLGDRMLMLSHVGRRSGAWRRSVLEVISHDDGARIWYVAAAWGQHADWYRNVMANPNAEVTVGRTRHRVTARTLDVPDAAKLYGEYGRQHPLAARFVGRAIGVDLTGSNPADIARRIPVVALAAVEGDLGLEAEVPDVRDSG